IAQRDAEIARLRAQLAVAAKNSSTSSKPPSSDIVKKPKDKPKHGRKRKRGGQVGHEAHHRPPFAPEQIDATHDYTLDQCPDCGGTLEDVDTAPRVLQQVEIIEVPLRIEEHRTRRGPSVFGFLPSSPSGDPHRPGSGPQRRQARPAKPPLFCPGVRTVS